MIVAKLLARPDYDGFLVLSQCHGAAQVLFEVFPSAAQVVGKRRAVDGGGTGEFDCAATTSNEDEAETGGRERR